MNINKLVLENILIIVIATAMVFSTLTYLSVRKYDSFIAETEKVGYDKAVKEFEEKKTLETAKASN